MIEQGLTPPGGNNRRATILDGDLLDWSDRAPNRSRTAPIELGGRLVSTPDFSSTDRGDGSGWSRKARQQPARRPYLSDPASLVSVVETEIIPRLMLAHRGSGSGPPSIRPEPALGPDATEAFAQMVVTREPDSLIAYVAGLLESGVTLDTIYADLLAPAAKRLGEFWDEDRVSFTDVTVGLGRLQQLVRALGWKSGSGDSVASLPRSVLFATVPGEQHVFGVFLLEDYFRRAGWRTWVETSATCEALVDSARGHWFDVFGLSASRETRPGDLARLVRSIRAASRNPHVFIMVGGRLFLDQPDMVSAVGADGTALSGGDALLIANHALLTADNQVSALAAGM